MTVHSPLVENCGLKIWLFLSNFERALFFSFWLYYITIFWLESNFQNGFQNLTYSFKFWKCSSLCVRIYKCETLPKVARVRKIWHFLSNFRSSPICRWIKSPTPSSQLAACSLVTCRPGGVVYERIWHIMSNFRVRGIFNTHVILLTKFDKMKI